VSQEAIVSVYATFGGQEEAERIARTVVQERLAACANVFGPSTSFYQWNGVIENAREYAALFKTRAEHAEVLIARVAELHSYDVPAVVVWPIVDALPAYRQWVVKETAGAEG
jgi:periplasmic divalent cation tolerance protein